MKAKGKEREYVVKIRRQSGAKETDQFPRRKTETKLTSEELQ